MKTNECRIGHVYVYSLGPIDFQPMTMLPLAADFFADEHSPYDVSILGDYEENLSPLHNAILATGAKINGGDVGDEWQGPTRFGSFPIIGGDSLCVYGIRKMCSNGTTIIASRTRMPWLVDQRY